MLPRDGSIVCSNSNYDFGTCYLITDYKKAAFASQKVLEQYGYSLASAFSADISLMPLAEPILVYEPPHRFGELVNIDGTVYFVGFNGLMGVPDVATLESWGYRLGDVVEANLADRNLPVRMLLEPRVAGEPRPFEPRIPETPQWSNEQKFIYPFTELKTISESWMYSPHERSIHGYVQHGGIDFVAERGTLIYAVADGYAVSSTHISVLNRTYQDKPVGFGLGEFVQIWHPAQGVYTSYSHMQKVAQGIPYFAPECTNENFCDPSIVYNTPEEIQKHGVLVRQGQLIGYTGDSGLSWGYGEQPGIERNHEQLPSWDETHLHFEVYTRDNVNFYKSLRYDPFGIYGRVGQYDESSYSNPQSLWQTNNDGQVIVPNGL